MVMQLLPHLFKVIFLIIIGELHIVVLIFFLFGIFEDANESCISSFDFFIDQVLLLCSSVFIGGYVVTLQEYSENHQVMENNSYI
jgi:hypothetical protein